jgi:hypothetical protein
VGRHYERGDKRGHRSEGETHERAQRNYLRDEGDNEERRERKPLVWDEKARIVRGSIIAVITEANWASGVVRSFRISREVPHGDGKMRLMPHVGERDLADFQAVSDGVVRWFAANGKKAP